MGIFSRLTDIVNANLSALLDRAEDPEKMVRLIIQEMEETLVEVRTTSARILADQKTLQRRRRGLQEDAEEWQRKAEVAMAREREDLARGALLERQHLQQALQEADAELLALDDSLAQLAEDIGRLEAKLKDARSRQQSLAHRSRTASARNSVRKRMDRERIVSSMGRFEQYERRIDSLEGQVDAHELGRGGLADEISALEQEGRLQEELEALRARVRSQRAGAGHE